MSWCQLCGFEMSRNICVQCVENLEDTGLDRDEAEEAYLAMAPEPAADEEPEDDDTCPGCLCYRDNCDCCSICKAPPDAACECRCPDCNDLTEECVCERCPDCHNHQDDCQCLCRDCEHDPCKCDDL